MVPLGGKLDISRDVVGWVGFAGCLWLHALCCWRYCVPTFAYRKMPWLDDIAWHACLYDCFHISFSPSVSHTPYMVWLSPVCGRRWLIFGMGRRWEKSSQPCRLEVSNIRGSGRRKHRVLYEGKILTRQRNRGASAKQLDVQWSESFFGYCFVAFVTHLAGQVTKISECWTQYQNSTGDLITRWSSKKSDIMWSLDAWSSSSF